MIETRPILLALASLVFAAPALAADAPNASERPNFLIILADDATYSDLPLYGGRNVRTPRIDRLASQGMTFTHAYVSMSMCLPCRTEMYTGLYPMRSGACWNHSAARPGTQSIVHYLGDLGYRMGIAGKVHVVPRDSFPFEMVDGFERGCVSPTANHECSGIRRFMNRDAEEPFCLVVGLVVPHVVWTVGDPSHFDQSKLELPPYFVDTPQTRTDYARYLAEIEVLDQQVGDVLDTLDKTGRTDRTMVIFTSEQGAQIPGCKWTNWEQGVHTGFLVRWPGRVQPGVRTDALIQYADVLPTLIDAAGGAPRAGGFDGSSFLPVLLGEADRHREFAYFMHNNIPEGPPYPIRAVTDGTYHYIRNLMPEALYIEKHVMGEMKWHDYWPSWVFDTTFSERTRRLVRRYMRRPPEQLYRTPDDPYEMTSLADDPQHADAKARLAAELDRWMTDQGDPGAALDTEKEWRASKQGRHFKRRRP
jgi:uncharacterized sulfatase